MHRATITLRISARGASDEACRRQMEPVEQTIRDSLGSLVFGEEEEELQHVLVRLLRSRGEKIACAEHGHGTSGRVAWWLSQADTSRHVFAGGEVSSSRMHDDRLHEASGTHATTAMAMAVRDRFGADYGLAIGPLSTMSEDGAHPRFYGAVAHRTWGRRIYRANGGAPRYHPRSRGETGDEPGAPHAARRNGVM